jgi:general secretion pathway protein A
MQAIRRKEGFIVLTGDIGTGKTTVCRALLQQLDAATFTSLILNPFLSVEELLREILLDFGVVSRDAVRSGRIAGATKHELISTLHDFLLSLIAIRGSGVLIIDEAQHLSPEVLEQIRIVSNLETNESKLLQIVLVGQLNLLDVLADAQMRQLDQRISLRAMLKPLTRDEVEAYVAHRLRVAKGSESVAFAPDAIDMVHAYSGGVPRVINLLCDRALMLGAELRASVVSPPLIEEAAIKLDLKAPEPPPSRWGRFLRTLRLRR